MAKPLARAQGALRSRPARAALPEETQWTMQAAVRVPVLAAEATPTAWVAPTTHSL
jgi:hypothetical protein